ncbi:hypothetical protein BJ878DRAFT_545367 [Calycina marina]|uniref:Rhodopsin domain-containing protein n=1 Tax=Calycina marina TaxID=1763456 RepID=A0A9P7YX39_9HELO|nr:hypothetical protein BJ878DRAFT_545367 [Calycina marina]
MTIPDVSVAGVVVNIALAVATCSIVALRFYSRRKHNQGLKADDWVILACLVLCISMVVEATYASSSGLFGVMIPTMSTADVQRFFLVQFEDVLVSHFTYGLIKISVVIFYKRIFTGRSFNISANVVMGAVIAWMIIAFFTVLLSSKGVSTYWTLPLELQGSMNTLNVPNLIISLAAVDCGLDLAVLSLPFPVIRKLRMSTTKKVYLSAVFLLGAFCLVSGAIRLWFTHRLFGSTRPDLKLDEQVYLWAHIEAYVSTITACLPTLSPLILKSRSIESIIGSIKSVLSLRSKSSSIFRSGPSDSEDRRSGSSRSSGIEKMPWMKNSSGMTESTATMDFRNLDLEAQRKYPERIVVSKTFASETI